MLISFSKTAYAYLAALKGWRRNFAAAVLGACAALALPPLYILPLMIAAFSGLFWLLNSADGFRRAAADGWWWGLGFFIAGTYWISIALLVDAEQFGWLIPFALLGLNGTFALYPMLACVLWYRLRRPDICGVISFAGIWTLTEFLRGILFTGFPWNLAGYVFSLSDIAVQPASWIGVYGLTWVAVALSAMPALLALREKRVAAKANVLAFGILAVMMAVSAWRLENAHVTYHNGIRLRIIQASIPQQMKWDPQQRTSHLRMYLELSRAPQFEGISHVIWPETAVPFHISGTGQLSRLLAQAVPPGGALITGVVREEGDENDWQVWNSVIAVDDQGNITAAYDKHTLVPFGEFVPLRSWMPIDKITPGTKDFSRGEAPVTLNVDGLPAFSPLICYEAIFPERVVDKRQRPAWLLNVTNDAWFGNSSGPYQHFQAARMRAVEQGLPVVRAANTGISAIINPYGGVERQMPLGMRGWLDAPLPIAVRNGTIYSNFGIILDLLLIVISIFCSIIRKQ